MRVFVLLRIPYRVYSLCGSRMLRSNSRFATAVTSPKVQQRVTCNRQQLSVSNADKFLTYKRIKIHNMWHLQRRIKIIKQELTVVEKTPAIL